MMTITQLKERKKELGYTNEMIAEKSGVPLSTIQKAFSGATKHPRYNTLLALTKVLSEYEYEAATYVVQEEAAEYSAEYDHRFKKNSDERWPRQGHYTIKDYFELPDQIRVELIDGVIYDMTAPKPIHQDILLGLAIEFRKCIETSQRDCIVRIAPLDVRLMRDDRNMFQPDILITCDESRNTGDYYDGPPELIAEILSPSTRSKDSVVKLNKYMEAGVKEYWIVDSDKGKVYVYYFAKDATPMTYSFEEIIPVNISEGECSIDFKSLNSKLRKQRG